MKEKSNEESIKEKSISFSINFKQPLKLKAFYDYFMLLPKCKTRSTRYKDKFNYK